MERLPQRKNRYGRQIGALLLSTSLLMGNEQSSNIVEAPVEQPVFITKNLISPFMYDVLDSQMIAGVVRDPTTNDYTIVKDHIPPPRDVPFRQGLEDPIAQLGTQSRAVDTIIVTESNNENGQFDPATNGVTLKISTSPYATSNVLKNPKMIPKAIDHEVTHALNKNWYEYLIAQKLPDDRLLAAKMMHVASTCIAMNQLILKDFVDENRELIASSFEEAGEGVASIYAATNKTSLNYQNSMNKSAEAVRQDNPIIYEAQRLSDPACHTVNLSSIVDSIAHQNNDAQGTDLISKMSLWSLQGQLDSMASKAFACITEGRALSELLHDKSPYSVGHPQDNPTEMASSIVTTLVSNPTYFTDCLDKMPDHKKDALINYLSAEVDIMNYTHPQLIAILRADPLVSDIFDKYVVIDK